MVLWLSFIAHLAHFLSLLQGGVMRYDDSSVHSGANLGRCKSFHRRCLDGAGSPPRDRARAREMTGSRELGDYQVQRERDDRATHAEAADTQIVTRRARRKTARNNKDPTNRGYSPSASRCPASETMPCRPRVVRSVCLAGSVRHRVEAADTPDIPSECRRRPGSSPHPGTRKTACRSAPSPLSVRESD